MNILKRYESDDFDESFDFDEPENGEFEETGSSYPLDSTEECSQA